MSTDAILITVAVTFQTLWCWYWYRKWHEENKRIRERDIQSQEIALAKRDEKYSKDVAFGVAEFISHVARAIARERDGGGV